MLRNLFSTMTALGLLVTACGDDGTGTTNSTTTASSTGSEGETTAGSSNDSTGPDTPTTAGMSEAMTSTTNVDPSTTNVDPSTSTSTGPDPDTTAPDTTSPETTAPETSETTDPSGGDPVDQCKMMADPMTPCSDCVCENCLEQLQACEADEGCTAIRMCAEDTGCTGLDCLDVCGDVIDMYGGAFGPSGMKGLAVSMCLMSSCANECG